MPRGCADDQLRLARQGRGHGPEVRSADVLPEILGLDQRAVALDRQTPHVRFLDYEVEIGLVVGRDIAVGTMVSK